MYAVTEDQKAMLDMVRHFASESLAPHAADSLAGDATTRDSSKSSHKKNRT